MSGSAIRDPDLYYFTIFGTPGSASWAWRYEGHHLSQNWTFAGGKAAATSPAFFGANPARVASGPLEGTRALAAEEDLAFAFLASLTEDQRRTAVVSATAPRDILTAASRRAERLGDEGLAANALTGPQQAALMKLIEEHAGAQPPALAAMRMRRVRESGLETLMFAWMGATERGPGNGHYYRIQGPSFLIEYDNTQNNANHQHIVWRDFAGDFGADVLAIHYAEDPEHASAAAMERQNQSAEPARSRKTTDPR
jgi:hypothetical protein